MIEPVARCKACKRGIFSAEMTEMSRERSVAWWAWQVFGDCANCAMKAIERDKGQKL